MNPSSVTGIAGAWIGTLSVALLMLPVCAVTRAAVPAVVDGTSGWVQLLGDAPQRDDWNVIGDADWQWTDGAVAASVGDGFLVSKRQYRNFELRVEFRADPEANSGVFIRCQDPARVSPRTCYEINILDSRPREAYATASIVDVAVPAVALKTDGRWSTLLIRAEGDRLSVFLNEVLAVEARDARLAAGLLSLQHRGAGQVGFRRVLIRELPEAAP
jgi:Domain of Unknown Function (DUF1080)